MRIYFAEADLREANLEGANLIKTRFTRADLSAANLTDAKLNGADLTGAHMKACILVRASLRGVRMEGANLDGSDFSGADLFRARLIRSKLRGCRFSMADAEKTRLSHSDCRNADMSAIKSLFPWQLSGTTLVNAKLPADVAKFDATVSLKECMEKSSKLFTLLCVVCVTCCLTILITGDLSKHNTMLNLGGLLSVQVPVRLFGWFMPLALASLFFYYHLHLRNVWVELSGLPAWFPDGRALYRRAYPWLLTTLVSAALPLLRKRLPRHFLGEFVICVVVNWYLVSLTILLMWYRYLATTDAIVSSLQVVALVFTVFIGSTSFLMAFWTIRRGWAYHNLIERILTKRAAVLGLLASAFVAALIGSMTVARFMKMICACPLI